MKLLAVLIKVELEGLKPKIYSMKTQVNIFVEQMTQRYLSEFKVKQQLGMSLPGWETVWWWCSYWITTWIPPLH